MKKDRISKQHIRDIVLGDGLDSVTIRLWGDARDEASAGSDPRNAAGTYYWIDFAVVECVCLDQDNKVMYQIDGRPCSPDPTYNIDEAEHVAEGFFKWDGCTQFTMDVHIDYVERLYAVLDAVKEARAAAAKIPGMWMLAEEYAS